MTDLVAPSLRNNIAQPCRRETGAMAGYAGDCACRGTEKTQSKNGAAMRVHATGRRQHRGLGTNADRPQARHVGAFATCQCQLPKKGTQDSGALAEQCSVHVVMTAR